MSVDPSRRPGTDGDAGLVGDDNDELGRRPWGPVRSIGSFFAGLVGSAIVLGVGGIILLISNGEQIIDDTFTGVLVFTVLVPGVVAPLAGGIASAVTSRSRWLISGYELGLFTLVLLAILPSDLTWW